MTAILPNEGSTSLEQLAAAIKSAPQVLGVEDSAELRAVLVPIGDGGLVSTAAVLRVGWPSQLPLGVSTALEAGGIVLYAQRCGVSNLGGPHDLTALLDQWRSYGEYIPPLEFQDNAYISRFESNGGSSPEPTWVVQLYEKSTAKLRSTLRSGPFLHPETQFFAEDIGDAVRQWVGDASIDRNSSLGVYKVVVRDRRAWLRQITRDLDTGILSVVVDRTTASRIFLTVLAKELDGRKSSESRETRGGVLTMPLPTPVAEIRVCLTDDTGTEYDGFRETEQYKSSDRPSILHPPSAADPEHHELREALDHGESETVEFKEWIPLDRKLAKSKELLRSAAAFANARGGVIYVGVADDCSLVGTEKQLGTSRSRDEYATLVRRALNEGVSPPPASNVSWVSHAGYKILRVQILAKGALHHVVEDGAIYVRRAASDRRATPAEIEAIIAQRLLQNGGLYPR